MNKALLRMSLGIALLLLPSVSHRANASLVDYSDRTSWENSVSGITTFNFDSLENQEFRTLSLGAVTFAGGNGPNALWVSQGGPIDIIGERYRGLGIALVSNYGKQSITATFSPGTTAVGVDIFHLEQSGIVTVTVLGGGQYTDYFISVIHPFYSFLGLTIDEGNITSIKFTPPPQGQWVAIDNFSYGAVATPVPLPPSSLLFGTGLVGCFGYIRWKLKRS
jgi:hypothetical protein